MFLTSVWRCSIVLTDCHCGFSKSIQETLGRFPYSRLLALPHCFQLFICCHPVFYCSFTDSTIIWSVNMTDGACSCVCVWGVMLMKMSPPCWKKSHCYHGIVVMHSCLEHLIAVAFIILSVKSICLIVSLWCDGEWEQVSLWFSIHNIPNSCHVL